ncbi:MAG TPA: ribosomal protein S18-alanine N-acetyltransferase [Acidobacteriota bacterium]
MAADLPALERIENEQFSNPWSRDYFAAELTNRFSHFFVAVDPGQDALVGFLLFWKLENELELHKIAVAGACQRRGHAAQLLDFFMRTGRSWGCQRAVLEVRAANTPAIRLYEKFAFRQVGRRRDYYDKPVEDALVYEFAFRCGGRGL